MIALNKREYSRMGLTGAEENIQRSSQSVTILPDFMAVISGEGAEQVVDLAQPGDLLCISSSVSLDPRQTLVVGEYCPFLYNVAEVSGQRFFFPDHTGLLKVVLRVTKEFRIDQVPYLIKLFSLGDFK